MNARDAYEAAYPAAKLAREGEGYGGVFAGMWAVWQAAVASAGPAVAEQVDALSDERRAFMALADRIEEADEKPMVISKSAAPALRAILAAAPVQPSTPDVIQMLLEVASCAYDAMDNTEENGAGLHWHRDDFDSLSAAMDKLEALPDDKPGFVMGPAAKAEWAMRAIPAAPVQAAPDGWAE